MGRLVVVLAVLLVLAVSPAAAQETPSTSTTATSAEVPTRDIVPKPDSGTGPTEAGDRGGALQLGLLGLLVVVLAGIVTGLVRQSGRARRNRTG